jgi:protein TonB
MNRRYQTAADMIKDLEAFMKSHYNTMPNHSHVAHFITNLFENEIKEENIEINLTPIPYTLTKKTKKEIEAKVELQEETIPELPEEDLLEESLQSPEEKIESVEEEKLEQDLMREEEFQPIIEITFDEDNKKKDIPVPEEKAIFSGFEALTPTRKEKKKKNLLFAGIIVIVIIVIAVVLFLMLGSGESGSGPGTSTEVIDMKVAQEQQFTAATLPDSDSESQTQEEKEALDTDAVKGNKPAKIEPQKEKEIRESTQISTVPQTSKDEKITPDKPEKTIKKKKTKIADPGERQPGEKQALQQDKIETTEEKTEPVETQKPLSQSVTEEPTQEVKKPAVEEKKTPDLEEEEIVKAGDILSPSQVDTQPEPISTPEIKINRSIRRLMTSDQRVLVSYLVDHNGNIETVKVLKKSSLKKLNTLIIETIQKWKYKPAKKNNIKVKVWKNKWIVIQN